MKVGILWLLAAAVASACAAPAAPGEGDDGTLEERPHRLRWHVEDDLHLGLGETVNVSVTYEDADGNPVTDLVDFALVGAAQDSSLGALDVHSDAAGVAEIALHASTIGASFRLRASAPLAQPILRNVSVARYFGDLQVNVRHEGSRLLLSREAQLYTGLSCDVLAPGALPAEDRWELVDDEDVVLFEGLAVGPSYAVVVMGESDGTLVAYGCASGLTVIENEPTVVDVVITDLTPSPIGEFEVASRLDLAAAVRGRPSAWLDGAREMIDDYGGIADFLIARVHGYVSSWYGTPASVRFDDAVEDARVRDALAAALEAPERDTNVLLDALAEDLEAVLEAPGLRSVLTIESGDAACGALHALDALVVDGAVLGLDVDVSVDLASLSVVSRGSGGCAVSDRDVVLDRHDLSFPLGTIAAGLSETFFPGLSEAESLPDLVSQTIDCEDVAALFADADADEDCDESCLADACREASAQLAASVTTALRAGDAELERIVLAGRASLEDEHGDLRAETLAGGVWNGSLEPSHTEIDGSFTATRLDRAY